MSDNEKKFTPHQQKEIDKINQEAAIRKKAEEELMANKDIQEFFRKFNPDSVTRFIEHYLNYKTIWHQHGENYLKWQDDEESKWIDAANEHLPNIQQKKLFDLQCLWRAEKITLPGVDICYDFQIWESNILQCPFIDPITADEVELYQEYLLQENAELENELHYSYISWQSYNELKAAYNTGNDRHNFPEWYDFYNSRKGTGVYMSLPDIRGEKEQRYHDVGLGLDPKREEAVKSIREVLTNPEKERKDKEGLPYLDTYCKATMYNFVHSFEDKLTKRYYKAYEWFLRNETDQDDVMEVVEMLLDAGEMVPIEGHYDWQEALFKAGKKYKARMIAESMPEAFAQYQLQQSMNIMPPTKELLLNLDVVKQTLIKDILNGRKELGEPEDLNF